MTKKEQYKELVRRYLENKASEEEVEVFFELLKKGKIKKQLDEAMKMEEEKVTGGSPEGRADGAGSEDGTRTGTKVIALFPLRNWARLAGAAVVTGLLLSAGLWYVVKKNHRASFAEIPGIRYSNDIQPGRNHAMLTVAGGKVIDLDSNAAGTVALQAGASLVKNSSGQWEYHARRNDNNTGSDHYTGSDSSSIKYNIISAPRGGQFSFVLEDGTKVWLNASSSMRFPTVFRGKSREVTLEGEAYFEVATNQHMPFFVQAGGMQVRVLGTHFNVNAYSDESEIRTTLLEGSVQIVKDRAVVRLQPGEQASCKPDGIVNTVKDPGVVDAAMAWRSGYFSFDEDNIQTVMRQISRWYDVDIHYEGPVTSAAFGGDIGRDLTLVQVLRVLEKSQVHFRLERNSLTILP